jgi:hypothetical protein
MYAFKHQISHQTFSSTNETFSYTTVAIRHSHRRNFSVLTTKLMVLPLLLVVTFKMDKNLVFSTFRSIFDLEFRPSTSSFDPRPRLSNLDPRAIYDPRPLTRYSLSSIDISWNQEISHFINIYSLVSIYITRYPSISIYNTFHP